MKFKNLKKNYQGEYITYYSLGYETENGNTKIYEMISRDPDIKGFDDLKQSSSDAVILILHDKSGERILLNREFRMAVGNWVYNFPAGLIDGGESVSETAKRELFEETGLLLTSVEEIWKDSYSSVGFSNEKGTVVVGEAQGEIRESDSEMEEINAAWYTKDKIKKLLQDQYFAARTQAYCQLWCRK